MSIYKEAGNSVILIFLCYSISNLQSGPIHEAAEVGSLDGIKLHLDNGVDVNVKNSKSSTALHIAVLNGYLEASKFLITQGAEINCEDKYGRTPLHMAAIGGHKKITVLLVDNGANINALTVSNKTPLDRALESYNLETADELKSMGGKKI
mgnify:CR=1 FL=1